MAARVIRRRRPGGMKCMAQQGCDAGVQLRGRWCSNVFLGRGRQLASMPEPHREPRKRAPRAARPPGRRRRRRRSWWRRAAIRRHLLPEIGTRPCPAAGLRQGRPGRSWVPPHQRDGRMWDCSEAYPPRPALTDRAARRGVLLALECKSWRPRVASVCPSMEALLGGGQQRRERARSQQRAADYCIARPC